MRERAWVVQVKELDERESKEKTSAHLVTGGEVLEGRVLELLSQVPAQTNRISLGEFSRCDI